MNPQKVTIGMSLTHPKIGVFEVLGIAPHCNDYAVNHSDGWVYLSNCSKV